MFSIIYTPTEGEAIQNFSSLFRRPEGCFLNILEQDRVYENLSLWGQPDDIDYIVVTDGEEVRFERKLEERSQKPNVNFRFSVLATKVTFYLDSWHLRTNYDKGVGGILISTAKLVLTTLCAGIHPSRTLPVVLDCGTNVS